MSRGIPVLENSLSRQASPLASVALNSVANVIGTHFAQPPFLREDDIDKERVRTTLGRMKNLCTIRTRDLKVLLRLTKDLTTSKNAREAKKLILYEYSDPKTAPEDVKHLWRIVNHHWRRFYKPSPTYDHAKDYMMYTADLLRRRKLEAQAKAIEDPFTIRSTPAEAVEELRNKSLQDFEIKNVEYDFNVKVADYGKPILWQTYSEAENKLTIKCYHPDGISISTVFAEVLENGFGNLMPYLKIIYTKAETQDDAHSKPGTQADAQDNCKFLWDNHLVHECRADSVAEGIKLCRDAAAWHWINLLFDIHKPYPSPTIADASTKSGNMDSASMDSELTESGMPKPFPEELEDVVHKLEEAGFHKDATLLISSKKARGYWYECLIEKLRNYQNP